MPQLNAAQAFQLAFEHHQAQRFGQAEQLYRALIQQDNTNPAILGLLGILCCQTGRYGEAIDLLGRAISHTNTTRFSAHLGKFYHYLGQSLLAVGDADGAVRTYQAATSLNPRDAGAQVNLGIALRAAGRLEEAIGSYRAAIAINPRDMAAHSNLGNALNNLGKLDEAIESHRKAVECDESRPEAHNNLGVVLQRNLQVDEAEACYRKAIELCPDYADAHNNLGSLLIYTWRLDEGLKHLRRALEIMPDNVQAHSNLLLSMLCHPALDRQAIFAEHQRWGQQQAGEAMKLVRPHANGRDLARRLRIGYLSPDFRRHSVSFFLEPFLANHDHARFEVFCYSAVRTPDDLTPRLRAMADHWADVSRMPDAQVVELVRRDGIDILVDLAGHTGNNRLLVLAYKPAPVQVTYLGYQDTSGLPTVEYRISDGICDPPGLTEAFHSEQLVRLGKTFACYRPPEDAPEVGPLQALSSGHVTFAVFAKMEKVSEPMLRLWSEILRRVAGSRLLLMAYGLQSERVRRRVMEVSESEGIAAERVELAGPCGLREYLARHAQVDVALDTFPFNGHTTTCHGLWMGVPIVSLAGKSYASRMGLSVLTNLGLAELAADSPQGYVEIAAKLAADLPRLAELRAGLRQRMQGSPMMDAPGFTRELERAYRGMWEKWCEADQKTKT
jgi:predicted O-linked N-acetylglucosamine transferase (SPINDLY family)